MNHELMFASSPDSTAKYCASGRQFDTGLYGPNWPQCIRVVLSDELALGVSIFFGRRESSRVGLWLNVGVQC